MRLRRIVLLGLAAAAMLASAASSFACPVCFGESGDPIVKGVQASVLFMVAVTYFLLGGGVITFFLLRRRARRLASPGRAEASGPETLMTLDEANNQGAIRQ